MSKVLSYKVILEPVADGGYTVYVPSLPGCVRAMSSFVCKLLLQATG